MFKKGTMRPLRTILGIALMALGVGFVIGFELLLNKVCSDLSYQILLGVLLLISGYFLFRQRQ